MRQVTTSWIFSLAHSPRMTCAHRNPRAGGERVKGSSAVILVLVAYKFQRVRPRSRPRCVAPPSSIHVCMTGHVLFTALDKSKAEKRSFSDMLPPSREGPGPCVTAGQLAGGPESDTFIFCWWGLVRVPPPVIRSKQPDAHCSEHIIYFTKKMTRLSGRFWSES